MSITIEALSTNIKNAISLADTTYLNSKISNFQAEIDAKGSLISSSGAASIVKNNNLTPSRILTSNASKKIDKSTALSSEINYLGNCTSDIKTQLDLKEDLLTGAVTTVFNNNLDSDVMLISNTSGKLDKSSYGSTSVTNLDNCTQDIQTKLDDLNSNLSSINHMYINEVHNIIEKWTVPTDISSITSVSGLSGSYLLKVGEEKTIRLTFTSDTLFHTDEITKLIKHIKITAVGGSFLDLNLLTSGIVINKSNLTIDLNYTASMVTQHNIEIRLKSPNAIGLGTTKYILNTSILSSNVTN